MPLFPMKCLSRCLSRGNPPSSESAKRIPDLPALRGILIPYLFSSQDLLTKNCYNFPGFPVDNAGFFLQTNSFFLQTQMAKMDTGSEFVLYNYYNSDNLGPMYRLNLQSMKYPKWIYYWTQDQSYYHLRRIIHS